MTQRVLVIGSGGISGFYAALLHRAGWQVDMVARSDYAVIRAQGLTVTTQYGDLSFRPDRVFAKITDADVAEHVLLGVKITAHTDLKTLVAPVVGATTHIALIANGLGIERPLIDAFPDNPLTSGVAYVGVSRTTPAVIEQVIPDRLLLASVARPETRACETLAAALDQAGAKVRVVDDIVAERWKKSVWNACFNPLSVLANGADTGQLLATEEAEATVRAILGDIVQVARAEGYPLSDTVVDDNIAFTRSKPPYKTSMALDYLNGRAIELDAILGEVIRCADKHQLDIAHLRTVYEVLRIRERAAQR